MLHIKNQCRILSCIRTVSLFLVSTLVLSACSSSYALAPWVASQSPVVKREIHAALQRTRIVYADSHDAKSLLKANNSDALLLSSGKYLVTKEVADDAMRLVRAVVHEDTEAMMQILEQDDRYRYNGIKELILSSKEIKQYYYDLCHDGKEPRHLTPELLLNDIVAKALEIMFVAENGFVVREDYKTEDERLKEARFYSAIKPVIMANRHNYFREGLFISPEDSRLRSESIRAALNKGFVFHQVAMPDEGDSGGMVFTLDDIKQALGRAGAGPRAVDRLSLSPEELKAITETITGSEADTRKEEKLLDILPFGIIGRNNISNLRTELERIYEQIPAITPEDVAEIKLLLSVFGWGPGDINRLSPRQALSEITKFLVKHGVDKTLIALLGLADMQMIARATLDRLTQRGLFSPAGVEPVSEVTREAAVHILRNIVAQAKAKQGKASEPKKKASIMIEPDVEIPEPLYECIRKVITMDFRDLVKGVDYDYTEGRSVYIKVSRILGKPLEIKGKTIRVIKLKGVCFNSDDRMMPFPNPYPIFKTSYGPDGEVINDEKTLAPPAGAMTMDTGEVDYELTDIAFKRGASVPMAIGKSVYEDLEFEGRELGVLILGIEKENEKDLRSAMADLAGEGHYLPGGSFNFMVEPEKLAANKDRLISLIRKVGLEYRKLHNCGVIQRSAHIGNVHVAPDGTIRLGDFEFGEKLENPTVAQDVAYRLNDFRAFFQMLAANLDQGLIHDMKNKWGINIYLELLAGYLGEHAREGAFSCVDEPIEIRRIGGVRRYVYECKIVKILAGLHHDKTHIDKDPLLASIKALVEADRHAAGTHERAAPGEEADITLDEIRRVLLESGVAQKVVSKLSDDELRRILEIAGSGSSRTEKTRNLFTILHSGRISRKNAYKVLTRLEIMARTAGGGTDKRAKIAIAPDVTIPRPLMDAIEKVITTDFRDLKEGVDYDYSEGRSVYIKVARILGEPLVVGGRTIRLIKLKGACFNSDEELVPYPRPFPIYRMYYGPAGEVTGQIEAPQRPTGAITMDAVDIDFDLTDTAFRKGVSVPAALGKASYEGLEFQDRPLGVLILGIEREDEKDLRSVLADMMGEGRLEPETGEFHFIVHPMKTRINKTKIISLLRRVGQTYRDLHNAGVMARGLHVGNIAVTRDGAVRLGDFEIGEKLEDPTVAQDVAYRVNDFRSLFAELAVQFNPRLTMDIINEFGINIFHEILAGYLGEHAQEGAFACVEEPLKPTIVGKMFGYAYDFEIDEIQATLGRDRDFINRDPLLTSFKALVEAGRGSTESREGPEPGAPAEALRTIYQKFGFKVFHREELYPLRKPYASSTVDVEIRMLEKLGILLPVIKDEDRRKKYHRLNESIRGATPGQTENNIRTIYNIKFKTSRRGNERPLDRYSIPDDKIPAVRERVKIELMHRQFEVSEKGRVSEEQCLIKAWNGYASPGYEKGMLTRIHNITENSPYKVDFREEDPQKLVDFAIANKNNKHVITILPYNRLTEEQIKRLINAEAQVIFMDFEREDLTGFDLNHIGGIIAAGISYLNSDDLAFMNIYRLLTDDNEHLSLTVEEFKKDPTKLKFILKPVEILDAEDLRNLHNRMEQLLTAA